jgi:hypothetical protein
VMEDLGEKVGWMLNTEPSCSRTVEGQDDQGEEDTTIEGVTKKYPQWYHSAAAGGYTNPEDRTAELIGVFEGKNMFL